LPIFRKIFLFILVTCFVNTAVAQNRFSFATDLGVQRNFKKDQLYWAIGYTAQAQFHITSRDGAYAWFATYSPGHYKNSLVAPAKSSSTFPQEIAYENKGKMRLKQFSLGWRRYLRGAPDAESQWSLYAFGGFGLLLGRVENEHSVTIDTADYDIPVLSGTANFKRLTLDIGAGYEYPVGADFYLYTEARAWIPTTAYPSDYIFVNKNAPFTGMLNVGLRILF
jgi:hypothetical protein